MKQFLAAFAAILATTAVAKKRPFNLNVTYANEDEIFLGIEIYNPATVKMPRAKAPAGSGLKCTGWQLADPLTSYTDFLIEAVDCPR